MFDLKELKLMFLDPTDLIIKSIAISSVIIVRGLFDYKYVRIIDDIAIYS